MMNFTEWDNRDEPQGLEGVRKRILSEAPRRKAAPMKVFKDPNVVDPKIAAQAKAREADAAKRAAIAKDRAVGNVDDAFQDNAPLASRAVRAVTGKEPKKPGELDLSGVGGGSKPPTKPPVASVPEPEENDNPKRSGQPDLDSLLKDLASDNSTTPEDYIRAAVDADAHAPSGKSPKKPGAFRPFQSRQLGTINELTSLFDERDSGDYFTTEAERQFGDKEGDYYFDTGFAADDENPFAVGGENYDLGSYTEQATSGGMNASKYKKSNISRQAGSAIPSFDEIQNFRTRFADPESRTPEGILKVTRPFVGRHTPKQVKEFVSNLPSTTTKGMFESGMGGAQGRQAVAKYMQNQRKLFPNLSDDEIKQKRIEGVAGVYLSQGMRDAYLSNENSKTSDIRNLAFDHIFPESDTKHWDKMIEDLGPEGLSERYGSEINLDDKGIREAVRFDLANDPAINAALTRKGFNKQQKKKKTIDELYTDKKFSKKYFGDDVTEDTLLEKLTGDTKKSIRKKLRQESFYKPLRAELKRLIDSGEMTPEIYNEIFDRYKEARGGIEGDISPKKAYYNDRTIDTDVWRMFADSGVLGYNLFAEEALRDKPVGHAAGWSGFAGTTSGSNAGEDSGEYPTYPFVPTATDHYRDAMYRHKLFGMGGDRDRAENVTNGIHLMTKLTGGMFTGGRIGSGDWSDYLGSVSEFLHDQLPPEAAGQFDGERAGNYKKVINVALNKLLKSAGEDIDVNDLDGNRFAPVRAFNRPGGVMQGVRNVIEDENSPWVPMILDAINSLGFNQGKGMLDMWDEVKDLTEQRKYYIIDGKIRLT